MTIDTSKKALDLHELASFFNLELGQFFKAHALFYNFFEEEGFVDFLIAKKHLVATGGAISLSKSPEYLEIHPTLCCVSGKPICLSSDIRSILLLAVCEAAEKGLPVNDSTIWHLINISSRRCCLVDDLTFKYQLFLLCDKGRITFTRDTGGEKQYQLAPLKKGVGRPRKY